MSALVLPILTAAAPLLLPLITALVHQVEGLFPSDGPAKLSAVTGAVTAVAGQLSTAGKIPGIVDPASIVTMIETVVQQLNAQGLLKGTSLLPASPAAQATSMGAPWTLGPFTITLQGQATKP